MGRCGCAPHRPRARPRARHSRREPLPQARLHILQRRTLGAGPAASRRLSPAATAASRPSASASLQKLDQSGRLEFRGRHRARCRAHRVRPRLRPPRLPRALPRTREPSTRGGVPELHRALSADGSAVRLGRVALLRRQSGHECGAVPGQQLSHQHLQLDSAGGPLYGRAALLQRHCNRHCNLPLRPAPNL